MQVKEVVLTHKIIKVNHLSLTFNIIYHLLKNSQKHLGMLLENKLNFDERIRKP